MNRAMRRFMAQKKQTRQQRLETIRSPKIRKVTKSKLKATMFFDEDLPTLRNLS